jgi:transposase-like zinc-binding protein
MTRPPLEMADIVRHYGDAYLARYGALTSTAQYRVLQAVAQCRTAILGGHKAQCDRCGHEEISYNSCLMLRFHLWGAGISISLY